MLYDRNDVIDGALAAIDAHPHRVNPIGTTEDGNPVCLYTDPTDPDCHCIVGQFGADKGLPVPGPDIQDGAYVMARNMGWPMTEDGRNALHHIQVLADNAQRGIAWRMIRNKVAALRRS